MIIATGSKSIAIGIDAKFVSSGKCTEPLKLPYDTLSELLNNPIRHCIFYSNGECYYAGDCERKILYDKKFIVNDVKNETDTKET